MTCHHAAHYPWHWTFTLIAGQEIVSFKPCPVIAAERAAYAALWEKEKTRARPPVDESSAVGSEGHHRRR